MANLPQRLPLEMMQQKWASQLNPIIANPIMSGIQLRDVNLAIGDNSVNHLLGRKPQGYIITGMQGGYSQIYDITSQTPTLTLVLNSSAAVVVGIYVY